MAYPVPTMSQYREQKIFKERREERKTNDILSHLQDHSRFAGHTKSDMKVDAMRRDREQTQVRREMYQDYVYIKGEQDRARRAEISEMESRLAMELEQQKAKKVREEMERRRICDSSEELRALKEKLLAANVNKHRAAQLLEQQSRQQEEMARDTKISEVMETERLQALELERKLEMEKDKQKQGVKKIQQEQMAQKEEKKKEAHDEYIKERDEVAEIVASIEREDEMEQAARVKKVAETREHIRQFTAESEARRKEREQKDYEENQQIEEYAQQKRDMEEKLAADKAAAEAEKKRLLSKIASSMENANREAEEKERLLNDLHAEELEAEQRRREDLQMRKRLEDRVEMMRAYEQQMAIKEQKRQEDLKEEQRFREELMAKFARDDCIEQLNAHKRRMKIQEHKRQVNDMVQERYARYEAERKQELDELQRMKEEEARRINVVEEERQRLLREFGADLLDHMPKGVLEHESDMDILNRPRRMPPRPPTEPPTDPGGKPPSARGRAGRNLLRQAVDTLQVATDQEEEKPAFGTPAHSPVENRGMIAVPASLGSRGTPLAISGTPHGGMINLSAHSGGMLAMGRGTPHGGMINLSCQSPMGHGSPHGGMINLSCPSGGATPVGRSQGTPNGGVMTRGGFQPPSRVPAGYPPATRGFMQAPGTPSGSSQGTPTGGVMTRGGVQPPSRVSAGYAPGFIQAPGTPSGASPRSQAVGTPQAVFPKGRGKGVSSRPVTPSGGILPGIVPVAPTVRAAGSHAGTPTGSTPLSSRGSARSGGYPSTRPW